jgi:hypothetical protein
MGYMTNDCSGVSNGPAFNNGAKFDTSKCEITIAANAPKYPAYNEWVIKETYGEVEYSQGNKMNANPDGTFDCSGEPIKLETKYRADCHKGNYNMHYKIVKHETTLDGDTYENFQSNAFQSNNPTCNGVPVQQLDVLSVRPGCREIDGRFWYGEYKLKKFTKKADSSYKFPPGITNASPFSCTETTNNKLECTASITLDTNQATLWCTALVRSSSISVPTATEVKSNNATSRQGTPSKPGYAPTNNKVDCVIRDLSPNIGYDAYFYTETTGSNPSVGMGIYGIKTSKESFAECSDGYVINNAQTACTPRTPCNAKEPDLVGKHMQPIQPNACDGTGANLRCTHACNAGYVGGSITCKADGTYDVAACIESTTTCNSNEPDLSGKYMQVMNPSACDGTATDGACSHTCIPGSYGGSITCQSNGTYVVVPCVVSTTPCNPNEPDLSGKNMQPINPDACDGTSTDGSCSHLCKNGYDGGSITCQGDGTYNVVACVVSITPCNPNEPDLSGKNMQPINANACDGTLTDGSCSHSCKNGYDGGSVTCQSDGTYTVVACVASTTTCNANEPDLSGKNMQPINPDACDGTTTNWPCSHSCKYGYFGGSVTCQGGGIYDVVACVASTTTCNANEPDLSGKNMQPINPDVCDGTPTDKACAHTCKDGYFGGSVICQGDRTYNVSACAIESSSKSSLSASALKSEENDSENSGANDSENSGASDSQMTLIIGSLGGVVGVAALVGVIIIFRRRSRKQKRENKPKLNSVVPITDNLDGNIPTEAEKVKNRAEKAWLVDEKV